jgi:hypothetical protein
VEYKEIQAAQGVKIAAKELEKAIAGEVKIKISIKNVKSDSLKFKTLKSRIICDCFVRPYFMCNRKVSNSLAHSDNTRNLAYASLEFKD